MSWRCRLLAIFWTVGLAGCADGGSGDVAYRDYPWDDRFYASEWIYYYDEDDEDFLAELTDEQKDALKQKWDSLPPEDKQAIRDRWNDLGQEERSLVRQEWGGLDVEQRQRIVSSMQDRIRSGTLEPVTPFKAGASGFDGGFNRSSLGARGSSFDRGSFGGLGGGGFNRLGGGGGRGGRR